MLSIGIANLKVIDIYHGDGTVDFTSIKNQGYDGVMIKATQGTTFKDNMCETNYQGAQSAGLHTGFYHYYDITNYNGVAQADFFMATISPFHSDYLPVMDVELTDYNAPLPNPSALSAAVKAALDTIKTTYTGSMLYSNPATLVELDASQLGSYPLWIAEYGVSQVKDVPGFGPWTGWQYTDTPIDQSFFTSQVFLGNTNPVPPNTMLDVQRKLIRLKVGTVQLTGVNDSATISAVMTFERIQKLTVDGIWGSECESAYAAIIAKPLLKQGSTGNVVRYLQFRVVVTVDGIFGPKTEAAVKAFQKQYGLTQDGIVGPKTWSALIG